MAKKSTFNLGGILDDADAPSEPATQRGSEAAERPQPLVGQGPSKRLSLVLDAQTYDALRRRAFEENTSHQALCEQAVKKFLKIT